jgi:hypothetical protein
MISLPTHPKVARDYAHALASTLSKMLYNFMPAAIAFI